MNRLTLATSILILVLGAAAQAQSVARVNPAGSVAAAHNNEQRALEQLRRLEMDTIVYRSLGEFEANSRLAVVPLTTFENELREVTDSLREILARLPAGGFKNKLTNSLQTYQDGLYWWRKIDHPRVVTVSALAHEPASVAPSDAAFMATIPYTVAIHWRQARNYLKQAEQTIGR